MSSLNALNAAAKKVKKADKVERPVVDCPASVNRPFYRFNAAKEVMDIAASRVEVEKEAVCEVMLEAYLATLFNAGCQPQNPAIQLEVDGKVDCKGIYQVKQYYKFNLKEGNEEVNERLISSLTDAGVSYDVAKRLVENEIDCTPKTALRPFNELMEGHYENKQFVEATPVEKSAAEKLISFVLGNQADPLTEGERAAVLVKEDRIKVKEGFLERVKVYCKGLAELKAIFRVIVPVNFLSHTKFAVSDTPEQKNNRLVDEFKKMVMEVE